MQPNSNNTLHFVHELTKQMSSSHISFDFDFLYILKAKGPKGVVLTQMLNCCARQCICLFQTPFVCDSADVDDDVYNFCNKVISNSVQVHTASIRGNGNAMKTYLYIYMQNTVKSTRARRAFSAANSAVQITSATKGSSPAQLFLSVSLPCVVKMYDCWETIFLNMAHDDDGADMVTDGRTLSLRRVCSH